MPSAEAPQTAARPHAPGRPLPDSTQGPMSGLSMDAHSSSAIPSIDARVPAGAELQVETRRPPEIAPRPGAIAPTVTRNSSAEVARVLQGQGEAGKSAAAESAWGAASGRAEKPEGDVDSSIHPIRQNPAAKSTASPIHIVPPAPAAEDAGSTTHPVPSAPAAEDAGSSTRPVSQPIPSGVAAVPARPAVPDRVVTPAVALFQETPTRPTADGRPREGPLSHAAEDHGSQSRAAAYNASAGHPSDPAHGAAGTAPASPAVYVTIGRVEIRAVAPPTAAQRPARGTASRLSLDEYLKRSPGGSR